MIIIHSRQYQIFCPFSTVFLSVRYGVVDLISQLAFCLIPYSKTAKIGVSELFSKRLKFDRVKVRRVRIPFPHVLLQGVA